MRVISVYNGTFRKTTPTRRESRFTNTFARDLAAALEEILEDDEILPTLETDDLETFADRTPECPDLEKMVKDLSRLLKKALTLSNKIRWRALGKSDGHYIHDDFFRLRKLISSALYPCVHRIKRVHIPALHHD